MLKFAQDGQCINFVSFILITMCFFSYFSIQSKVILQEKKVEENISSIRTEMTQLMVRFFKITIYTLDINNYNIIGIFL